MRVEYIFIYKQITENLHLLEEEIEPRDLLKIMRYVASQGRTISSIYENKRLFYGNGERITKPEFDLIYEKKARDVHTWFNRFTREDFINRLGSTMKIVSSTTKEEIIKRIATNKDVIFNHFKIEFLERYSAKWREFKRCKILLPPDSDETKKLTFLLNSRHLPVSGKNYLQYWCLGDDYRGIELTRDFKTGIFSNSLTVNLKDNDEAILRWMEKFAEGKDSCFEIRPIYLDVTHDDLQIKDSVEIAYGLGIYHLVDYFGMRKGSKFKTFSEGLRMKADSETIKKLLDRKFLIVTEINKVYCGIEQDKELFEKLCWHLKIEYLKDKRIICRVVENETFETLAALWELINGEKYTTKFSFIEL